MRTIRTALSGTFTLQGVGPRLRQVLASRAVMADVHVSGFGRLMSDLTDPDAATAHFDPQVMALLLHDDWFLPGAWGPDELDRLPDRIGDRIDQLRAAIGTYLTRSHGTVLLHTVPLSARYHRSLVGQRSRARLARIWRELNLGLIDLADQPRVAILDFETALADAAGPWRDERLYAFAGLALSPRAEQLYAEQAGAYAAGVAGAAKKLLVVDLDNTLWGGVLGDDGPAGLQLGEQYPGNAYGHLQRFVRALRQQGVLLAIASRNDDELVERTLRTHPHMTLRPDDFVARRITWGRKDISIRQLCDRLNLGPDSVVFLDDSALERDMVGGSLPEVTVLAADGDPADLADAVLLGQWFDVPETTSADRERTLLYQKRTARAEFADSFPSPAEYLRGLQMTLAVKPADEFTRPRLEQLRGRTNQFSATGPAFPVGAVDEVLTMRVTDRFGDEGIVGGVWVSKSPVWTIENLVLSCRVFDRHIEHAVVQLIADAAAAAGAPCLDARLRPTDRNAPIIDFYAAIGFVETDAATSDGVRRLRLPLPTASSLYPDWMTIEKEWAGV